MNSTQISSLELIHRSEAGRQAAHTAYACCVLSSSGSTRQPWSTGEQQLKGHSLLHSHTHTLHSTVPETLSTESTHTQFRSRSKEELEVESRHSKDPEGKAKLKGKSATGVEQGQVRIWSKQRITK